MQSDYHVVLVDDDRDLLEALQATLTEQFKVHTFTDPQGAIEFLDRHTADAVVLDYHIPGRNPFDVYASLKERKFRPPVLFLTGEMDRQVKIECLDKGIDDFIHKPVSVQELAAHLRNRIKSYRDRHPTVIRVKNIEVNLSEPLVLLNGKQLALTPKEFQILSLLLTRLGSVVKKTEIVEHIWPEVKVEENNVDTHISNLRKKLRDFECELKTIKCFGYVIQP